MGFLAPLGLNLFFLGLLFILKSRKNKRYLLAGIPLLIAGILTISYVIVDDVDTNLIGMQILKDEPQEFIVEFHYFPTKAEAFSFYKKKGVAEFLLLAKYEGDTENFFKMINVEPTADGGKRIAFLEDQKKNDPARIVCQDFFMTHKLFTVYNSAAKK